MTIDLQPDSAVEIERSHQWEPPKSDQLDLDPDNEASHEVVSGITNDGGRIRLGFVPGGENAMFALPSAVTSGTTTIRFEARPVRRGGEPVISEVFGVHTGDEIAWSIPPQ